MNHLATSSRRERLPKSEEISARESSEHRISRIHFQVIDHSGRQAGRWRHPLGTAHAERTIHTGIIEPKRARMLEDAADRGLMMRMARILAVSRNRSCSK